MKYKRKLMSGMFAIALLTSNTSVFAADIPVAKSKIIQQSNQVKMKSHGVDNSIDVKDASSKNLETKDNMTKKFMKKKHKKVSKIHTNRTTSVVKSFP